MRNRHSTKTTAIVVNEPEVVNRKKPFSTEIFFLFHVNLVLFFV